MFGPEENKMQGNIDWLETFNLALSDRVSCDTVNCSNEALYYAHVRCCNAPIVHCEGCLRDFYKSALWMVKNNKAIICVHCKTTSAPQGWLSRPQKLSLLEA